MIQVRLAAIGEPRDRNAERRIEKREGQAAHQAELRVAQVQLGFDRHGENCHDLPIDEVEGVHQHQHRQHVGAVGLRGLRGPREWRSAGVGTLAHRDRKRSRAATHSGSSSSGV